MFHPLLPDLTEIKDQDLENKITELTSKYYIAARYGNGAVCSQIAIVIEQYKEELQKRHQEKLNKLSGKNQNKDLDDLINIG